MLRGAAGWGVGFAVLGRSRLVLGPFARDMDTWREFEIVTHVELPAGDERTRVWMPTPLALASYQRSIGDTYRADGGVVEMVERPDEALDMLVAEWPAGVAPILRLTSRVATRSHPADLAKPTVPPPEDLSAFAPFLRPTRTLTLNPEDRALATEMSRASAMDADRARSIFTRITDPARLVAILRAAGIPARLIAGLSLERQDATRAQVSRVEVYLTGFGWVPIDCSAGSFGTWGTAWAAYSYVTDVTLPGSKQGPVGLFMYPQAETGGRRLNNLDPEEFHYDIAVRELAASTP